jgi:hypothetical protein
MVCWWSMMAAVYELPAAILSGRDIGFKFGFSGKI